MTQDFEGMVALITGAGSGIGRAIVSVLAERGATVVGVDRNAEALAETSARLSSPMTELHVDVTSSAACAKAVADTVLTHGRLDVLGNVAGIARSEHFTEVTVDEYRKMMAVNMDACFFLTQAAMPHLLETDGSVISISSTAGVIGQAYSSTYAMSKAAVIQMTKALAMEYLKSGVRINAIAPGGINTPMIANFQVPEGIDSELMQRYAPVRAVGEPEDVASMFAYLASNEARAIHGAVFGVDHGMTAG